MSERCIVIKHSILDCENGIENAVPVSYTHLDMAAHGIKMDLEQMTVLIPSTFQVVFILGIMAFVSFLLIDRLYKRRGE